MLPLPWQASPALDDGARHPGGGFFCLQFPDDAREETPILMGANTAMLSSTPGALSREILERELQHLFEGAWD